MPKLNQRKTKTKRTNHKLVHKQSTYKFHKLSPRLAHNKHTAKRLPFYCTSYAVLFFLLMFVSSLLLFVSHAAVANQQEQGSINFSGTVKGPAPELAASIHKPSSGTRVANSQLEVSGSCIPEATVEIYRNNNFAGDVICNSEGIFSLMITLTPGQNDLKARMHDNGGQYGPDSGVITVYYDLPASLNTNSSTKTPGESADDKKRGDNLVYKPFLIAIEPSQRGVLVDRSLSIPYKISGGTAPYSVAVDWGYDTSNSLTTHDKPGEYNSAHVFKQSGQIIVRYIAIGADKEVASIQIPVSVYGLNTTGIASVHTCAGDGSAVNSICINRDPIVTLIDRLWPALIVATLMTISFWIGEKVAFKSLKPKLKQKFIH